MAKSDARPLVHKVFEAVRYNGGIDLALNRLFRKLEGAVLN